MTLHTEAVSPALFNLLQKLMEDEAFRDFYLVGGTALALRFGHRESVDIDLFTHTAFDASAQALLLKEVYGMKETETAENTVRGLIDGIKVDVIAHRYPLLKPIEDVQGVRLISLEDSAAMKLNARDQLLDFCRCKYEGDSLWNVEKSLCYFDDAENEPNPRDLRGQSWAQVKATIAKHNRL